VNTIGRILKYFGIAAAVMVLIFSDFTVSYPAEAAVKVKMAKKTSVEKGKTKKLKIKAKEYTISVITAQSSDKSIATVKTSKNAVRIKGVAEGTAEITTTVTALTAKGKTKKYTLKTVVTVTGSNPENGLPTKITFSKTGDGSLEIDVTDTRNINVAGTDYPEKTFNMEDNIYDIIFYGSKALANGVDVDQKDYMTSIARLIVYAYGARINDFKTYETGSGPEGLWEYVISSEEEGFAVDGDTIKIRFSDIADIISKAGSYTCYAHESEYEWKLSGYGLVVIE